eukprot:TRINITY_DN11797_c0_g1_i1.p1 TRINITY_DN11797_c0_g1~~TRINITY_DN11797_c0_g1_i1.p1  ORF type:complete len:474 (+),score=172.30 TRINITY_DN11797_c0_g1_i1:43-1464(+)
MRCARAMWLRAGAAAARPPGRRRWASGRELEAAKDGPAPERGGGGEAEAMAAADDVDNQSTFTREEVREIIGRTWEEKIQMGEEEASKAQENDEPIFQEYPLTGYCATSLGPMPVPFQFKNSSGVCFGGFGDVDVVKDMIQGQDLHPVVCEDGSTPIAVWVWQHSSTSATLESHSNSMQMYFFVTREPLEEKVPAHPLIHHALWSDTQYPDVRCLPWGMWEESEQALAYNREILGFPSLPALGYVENHTVMMKDLYNEFRRIRGFSFVDTLTGHTIAKGEAHYWDGGLRSPSTYARLAQLLGPKEMALRQLRRYQTIPLVCPKTSFIPHHADSELLFQSNLEQLRMWNKSKPWDYDDRMLLGRTRWAGVRFTPRWVNHYGGCQGVILPPYNHNGETNPAMIGWEAEEPTFPHLPLAAMDRSLRHGRIPAGSPINVKGMAHLPDPDTLEAQRLLLSLQRRGVALDTLKEQPKLE